MSRWGLAALQASGLARALAPRHRGRGIIFCLHHVVEAQTPDTGFAPFRHLEVTSSFLHEVIGLVRRRGYDAVSLDEALLRLAAGRGRPVAVFTLDDGYRDNLQVAAPVFRAHECPYAVFVSPGFIDGRAPLWWRGLEAVVGRSDRVEASIAGRRLSVDTGSAAAKEAAFARLLAAVDGLPHRMQMETIVEVCERQGVDILAETRDLVMTWDQVREMHADPLATIGAHTVDHPALAHLEMGEARVQMARSKDVLEREIGGPVHHLAYPYGTPGAAGEREFRLARELGFRSASTLRPGVLTAGDLDRPHALPRVILSGRYQHARYVDALMSGVPLAAMRRLG